MRQKMKDPPNGFEPTLTIKTKNYDHSAEITIKDNGVGMSDAVLRKIFQPFFSTKPLDEGTGLGLALTYDIVVQEHHGTIVATSQKGVFTEIVITLPKSQRTKNT
jgi:signal transduction histidine kinase